jgi:hypothetical protein
LRKAGLTVNAGDLESAKAAMETGELSDSDLERVAGGGATTWINATVVVLGAFG